MVKKSIASIAFSRASTYKGTYIPITMFSVPAIMAHAYMYVNCKKPNIPQCPAKYNQSDHIKVLGLKSSTGNPTARQTSDPIEHAQNIALMIFVGFCRYGYQQIIIASAAQRIPPIMASPYPSSIASRSGLKISCHGWITRQTPAPLEITATNSIHVVVPRRDFIMKPNASAAAVRVEHK